MALDLSVILFMEFEQAPNSIILELVEKNGGRRSWEQGNRFIIQFDSATKSIVAGQAVLRQLQNLNNNEQVRSFIDVCEVNLEGGVPTGAAVNLGWSLLSRGEWNMVYFSESTRLTLRHSEHSFLSRPEEWLEPGVGKISLHRLLSNYTEKRLRRENEYEQQSGNLSTITPAPRGRRAFAGLLDFLLAALVLLLFRVIVNAPVVYSVISTRRVIEAEDMEIRHGYISPTWLASSGSVVHMGRRAQLSFPFPYKTGSYKVRVVFRTGEKEIRMRLQIGDRTLDWKGFGNGERFSDVSDIDGRSWEEYINIEHGEQIRIRLPEEYNEWTGQIDFVQFMASGDHIYTRVNGQNILRSEDVLRLIGVWEYSDLKYHLRDVFVLCPAIQMVLHLLFLSLFTWTPGALMAGIRIVSRKGPRSPGVVKALLRVIGYILSVIPFIGVGLIWPLIVNKNENWSDMLSSTRVITSEGGADEE